MHNFSDRCSHCGDPVNRNNLGWEGLSRSVSGSMFKGRRRVVVCADCNSAGEYQQHLARQAEAAKWQTLLSKLEAAA